MKSADLKKLIIRSLDLESDPVEISGEIESAGVNFKFRDGFSEKVLDRVYSTGTNIVRKIEFVRNLNYTFYRIALTGAAAIVVLLISLFIMEGSFSLDSLLGLGGNYDETILCLITGY
jgi:hypothetical protein